MRKEEFIIVETINDLVLLFLEGGILHGTQAYLTIDGDILRLSGVGKDVHIHFSEEFPDNVHYAFKELFETVTVHQAYVYLT